MDVRHDSQRVRVSAGLDHSEEMLAEVDEPPDAQCYFSKNMKHTSHAPTSMYTRAQLMHASRRESLLTRQLNSENDNSTEEDEQIQPTRGLSTASIWSTQSTASTAELTSDDGRSVASPTTSPPLRPTKNGLPVSEKSLAGEPRIVGLDAITTQDKAKDGPPEKAVEAGLGRKRCITFACGNKTTVKAASPPTPPPSTEEDKPASPPKRKCMIKFACPARAGAERKDVETVVSKRPVSPPPPQRRISQQTRPTAEKAHRGSDSTVTHVSPKNLRTSSSISVVTRNDAMPKLPRKLSNGSDSGGEGTRFHEFATSDDEPEEWIQESTCWRSRLTVSDTLKKENIIRQLGEEVDEEALQEEDEDDLEDTDDDPAEDDDDDEDDDLDVDELDDDSDDGFHSDNEEGFAVSDSDEDSENEWWTPAGRSTAATSMDHIDHLTTNQFKTNRTGSTSSINSSGSDGISPRSKRRYPRHHKSSRSEAMNIQRPGTPDLPDSTDFVCGTLDEDRPLEQAYITRMKEREAAKHRPMPQDIDPTFPTSDPDMDEEDDEDIEDPEESESDAIMHGDMDPLDNERRTSFTPRRKSVQRSPPVTTRMRSPAPPRRPSPAPRRSTRRSPPPRSGSPAPRRPSPAPVRRSARAGSPAPRRPSPAPFRLTTRAPSPAPRRPSPAPLKVSARARSPAPAPRRPSPAPVRRSICRSPPPPVKRSATAPVRKLFGQSPQRFPSQTQGVGMSSPPNTRSTSPTGVAPSVRPYGIGLGARPAPLTHTASLPRTGGFQISRMDRLEAHDIDDESDTAGEVPLKRRGAIDIVKGLEKKRLRRKEKMHQKACAKAAAKGEKLYKVKPGKGCERMREVGLELQRYKGKGEHILSV
jgi:hypothetical protein